MDLPHLLDIKRMSVSKASQCINWYTILPVLIIWRVISIKSTAILVTPRSVFGIMGNPLSYGIYIVLIFDDNNHIQEIHEVMYWHELDDHHFKTPKQGRTNMSTKMKKSYLLQNQRQNLTINHFSTFATLRYLDFGEHYSSKVSPVIDDNPVAYEWNTRLMILSTSPSPYHLYILPLHLPQNTEYKIGMTDSVISLIPIA